MTWPSGVLSPARHCTAAAPMSGPLAGSAQLCNVRSGAAQLHSIVEESSTICGCEGAAR